MKTAYDLYLELLTVMGDIDRAIDKKSRECRPYEDSLLGSEIDRLEIKMIEIKNKLKGIEV